MPQECPICKTHGTHYQRLASEDRDHFHCPRCGVFQLLGTAARFDEVLKTNRDRMLFSHIIRQSQRQGEKQPSFGAEQVTELLRTRSLPTLEEQIDNLVLFIGDHQESPSTAVATRGEEVEAIIGASRNAGKSDLTIVLEAIREDGKYLRDERPEPDGLMRFRLSIFGWRRYRELKARGVRNKRIFMAMSFGNAELRTFVEGHLRSAVGAAGFELFVLTDSEPAGLIDERMRVEIRNSRMLIADLTDKNNGAYFEAGFAEGLGRPVLYICEAEAFKKERHVHFDTSHHQVITWSAAEPQKAASRVKWSIRNTLPGEAKMTDE